MFDRIVFTGWKAICLWAVLVALQAWNFSDNGSKFSLAILCLSCFMWGTAVESSLQKLERKNK